MNALMLSLKNRLKEFLDSKTFVTQNYISNTDPAIVFVDDVSKFNVTFAMRNYPQATFYFNSGGTDVKLRVKIKAVDKTNNTITLDSPPTQDIPIGAYLKRTPNWQEVNGFYLGDPASIPANNLPAICVSPSSKDIEWYTLTGTKEKEVFNIFVHVLEDNQDDSTITMVRLVEDVVELLNADLHIKIQGRDVGGYNRTYNSLVNSIQYGYSNKGQFCKSAQISWFGEEYWSRMYVVGQELANFDSFE